MASAVRRNDSAGDYATLGSARVFAGVLTRDLQDVSGDRHLRIVYSAESLPEGELAPTAEQQARRAEYLKSNNYGFGKTQRFRGGIAYLELHFFTPATSEATRVADEALSALADAPALIFDLRRNGGGSPAMIAHVSSYLFDAPSHLNSLHWRRGNRVEEFWTTRDVRGTRFGQGKPVYVLTSARTFSGAEEFAYNLKNLKRATIVGDKSGGGAHPTESRRLHEHFFILVPTGRAVSPVTGTNWEGSGVTPDVAVPAHVALEKALELAEQALAKPR